ncbi:hypothetical protein CCACVL1_08444 [Corchorus capsularis]|uniref:Uncharacterized protein n=1 Tax=Corchorus capsularis TaxID=210143 RepID=A0A1R3J0K9_COCAP|nr:hypothetical protein CCACVL1_08444 [Corchorus capsularis]
MPVLKLTEYEYVRASLPHRDPLPTLNVAIKEIIFEETRLGLVKSHPSDVVLVAATTSETG